MKNILFIAYHFPPIGGAPVQRTLNFIKYLLETRYRAIVITGPGKIRGKYSPEDKELINEIPPKIPIYRVDSKMPQEREGVFRKIQSLLNVPRLFSKWWIPSAIKLSERAYKENGANLIYATMSPFESAYVASYLSKEIGIPWVADLRDAWILDEIQKYPTGIHKRLKLIKMHSLLSTASIIVMNTPEATDRLKRTFPDFKKKRVLTITNGFDPPDFKEKLELRNDKKFSIVHIGHFITSMAQNRRIYEMLGGAERGVDTNTRSPSVLFNAIDELCKVNTNVMEHLEIVFVGSISKKERTLIETSKLSEVCRFTGFIPHKEAFKILRTADMLFLPMHNLPPGKRSTSIPSKMYEYMASGRPILGAVPDGDAREFLADSGTAFLCRPDDCDGMMRILCEVYDFWEKNEKIKLPNNEYLSQFERKNLAKMLARELDALFMKNS